MFGKKEKTKKLTPEEETEALVRRIENTTAQLTNIFDGLTPAQLQNLMVAARQEGLFFDDFLAKLRVLNSECRKSLDAADSEAVYHP